MRDNIRYDTNI